MKLLTLIEANPNAIRTMGRRAIESAKRDGVAAYYRDPDLGYVRELPDGTREQLLRKQGRLAVVGIVRPD